jgi:hypothetical protein
MKHLIPYILLLALLCTVALFAGQGVKETFQSAGTLVQLQTSHVPTLEEVRDEQLWLRKRVRQDLLDLTGSP